MLCFRESSAIQRYICTVIHVTSEPTLGSSTLEETIDENNNIIDEQLFDEVVSRLQIGQSLGVHDSWTD